jgi:hypothetical protein
MPLEGPALEISAVPHAEVITVPVTLTERTSDLQAQTLRDYRAANLNEEFVDRQGQLLRYNPYSDRDRLDLRNQAHVDIRSFVGQSRLVNLTVGAFSAYTVQTLSTQTVGALQTLSIATIPGEGWTAGAVASDPTRNNWRGLSLTLAVGVNTTSSVITVNNTDVISMDLDTGFDDNDFVSMALPAFPRSSINLPASSISFTSNTSGSFTDGPTVTVPFDQNLVSFVQGDSEFRFKRSLLNANGLDLSNITGIRFTIQATAIATFRVMALRLLKKTWKYGRADTNTYFAELQSSVSRTGNPNTEYERIAPILWRSADVAGAADPRPIDAEIGVAIFTGSISNSNEVSLYFREASLDMLTQLDLNGFTQANLNSGGQQPDLGLSLYDTRPQSDLDNLRQAQIDSKKQFDLERTPDSLNASWIRFTCRWGPTDTIFTIVNTEGGGYSFNLGTPLTANSSYLIVARLEGEGARLLAYPIGGLGQILPAPIFDSSMIIDSFAYKRRKGRFGWSATLVDGDAAIRSIRERGVTYAEYRSLPFNSQTPVDGVELNVASTANFELFEDFTITDPNMTLSTDGTTWTISNPSGRIGRGVRSNQFVISDFEQTEISFELFYTGTPQGLDFSLVSASNDQLALTNPPITPNVWQPIRLQVPFHDTAQTGPYRLVILQNEKVTDWRIRNISIFKRSVSWYSRTVTEEARSNSPWIPFKSALNNRGQGIKFPARSRRLQVLGKGHFEGAQITRVQFQPKYAGLGRRVWPEDQRLGLGSPTASFSSANVGRFYTFTSTSSDVRGELINWYWTISDGGSHYGPVITHEFTESGTFGVTLTVRNRFGLMATSTAILSVA